MLSLLFAFLSACFRHYYLRFFALMLPDADAIADAFHADFHATITFAADYFFA